MENVKNTEAENSEALKFENTLPELIADSKLRISLASIGMSILLDEKIDDQERFYRVKFIAEDFINDLKRGIKIIDEAIEKAKMKDYREKEAK